jgi:hypothetical protein
MGYSSASFKYNVNIEIASVAWTKDVYMNVCDKKSFIKKLCDVFIHWMVWLILL